MIDIVKHSVKVKDVGLLQFLYPEYIITDEPLLFSERPIIFTGPTKYINRIKTLGVDYIIVSELPEYDLTDRKILLEVVYSKYNKTIPKYLLEFYTELDDNTFREEIENFWITGKWRIKEYDLSGAFIELLQSFKTDTYNITKTYLRLLNKSNSEYIETSLFTFLNKVVMDSKTGNISKWYSKIINDYRNSKSDLIEVALNKYLNSKIDNKELKVFNLIMDMNRRS